MTQSASAAEFVEPGVYQRLACGCVMYALAVAPLGPCLCIVENAGECGVGVHAVEDFLPIRWSPRYGVVGEKP